MKSRAVIGITLFAILAAVTVAALLLRQAEPSPSTPPPSNAYNYSTSR